MVFLHTLAGKRFVLAESFARRQKMAAGYSDPERRLAAIMDRGLGKLVGRVIKACRQHLVQVFKYLGCDVRVAAAETVQICLGKA